jgi:hypothetical protein
MRHKSNGAGCPAGGLAVRAQRDLRAGKPSLTVFCGNCAILHNISADSASSRDLDSQELPPWNLKALDHRSSNRSNSVTC